MRAQTVPGAIAVATYDDYADAQRAVDFLADNRFPVDRVTIIGLDLRLEERVVGRLTVARAALAGAGTGAWFGLLIGLLLGLFTSEGWLWVVLIGRRAPAPCGARSSVRSRTRSPVAVATSPRSARSAPTGTPSSSNRSTPTKRSTCSRGSVAPEPRRPTTIPIG